MENKNTDAEGAEFLCLCESKGDKFVTIELTQ